MHPTGHIKVHLHVEYISTDQLHRSDPADLKRRNLRDLEIVCISDATSSNHSKPDGKTQEGYCASTRKPANETTPSKRKQNCIKTKTQSRIVHSRALRVAYRVLSLHRPTTTKMRKYYLSILEKAMQKASEDYTAWAFIQRVIHFALEDDDETASDSDTHSKDGIDEAKKALSLLEFLITLITEDIKNSPYGKAVQELLTWDIFWGPSKAYNVVPPPVKKLIQLWMSHETSFVLRMALSRLVTLVLELLWKLSGHPLVPVFALPDTLAAMEIEIQVCCKGVSFEKRVEMVRSLPNPWAQCIVSFIILQEALQCPRRLTLASLISRLVMWSCVRPVNAATPRSVLFTLRNSTHLQE
ncbi:hypothetical protein E2C01_017920 [Portunus trituberculatus]|uniref:Uncharacterized protein n=1 Tax=Portunus trituberculatus TaxID=210409 RepID=A0A5B7DV47_PORTR|nr:hypothetical protein [Portunus trituberculatus]